MHLLRSFVALIYLFVFWVNRDSFSWVIITFFSFVSFCAVMINDHVIKTTGQKVNEKRIVQHDAWKSSKTWESIFLPFIKEAVIMVTKKQRTRYFRKFNDIIQGAPYYYYLTKCNIIDHMKYIARVWKICIMKSPNWPWVY